MLQAELGVAGSIEDAAQVLAKKLNKSFVVTLGAEGAIAVTADGVERVASMKITPVDTVGAGDTFCGYFAAQLAEGVDIAQALALSAKAASIACLNSGAQGAIPTRAQVDAYSA